MSGLLRMNNLEETNPEKGQVVIDPIKGGWFALHSLIAVVGGCMTISLSNIFIAMVFTALTLCLGHTVGLHRLLVHRSFSCPRWLEYGLVHLGVIVGMGGPHRILYMHDIRDWAQRHQNCHNFYIHQTPIWKDFFWQNFCRLDLEKPPVFTIEPEVENDKVYKLMERTWFLQPFLWSILLYTIGGWGAVIWGTSVRMIVSLTGHWLVGYLVHNSGEKTWHLEGHAIQGHNIPQIGLITMGEGWHNNHHAYPESARLGVNKGQLDPGWWVIKCLEKVGLVWNIKLPENLEGREEVHLVSHNIKNETVISLMND